MTEPKRKTLTTSQMLHESMVDQVQEIEREKNPPMPKKYTVVLAGGTRDITLGKSEKCDITIDDVYATGKHAKIHVADDKVRVQDLGSTNGTMLNGRKLMFHEATIEPGLHHIIIGRTEIEVRLMTLSEYRRDIDLIDSAAPVFLVRGEQSTDFEPVVPPKTQSRPSRINEILKEAAAMSERKPKVKWTTKVVEWLTKTDPPKAQPVVIVRPSIAQGDLISQALGHILSSLLAAHTLSALTGKSFKESFRWVVLARTILSSADSYRLWTRDTTAK